MVIRAVALYRWATGSPHLGKADFAAFDLLVGLFQRPLQVRERNRIVNAHHFAVIGIKPQNAIDDGEVLLEALNRDLVPFGPLVPAHGLFLNAKDRIAFTNAAPAKFSCGRLLMSSTRR
jgi:hypothetical protein